MGYAKTLSQLVLELLRDNLPSGKFKGFYNGDPLAIPQSSLPCICVSNQASRYEFGPTGHDENNRVIVIKAVFNKKDVFGKSPEQANLELLIENSVEGIDEETGELSQQTIVGILRRNTNLGTGLSSARLLGGNIDINYLEANQRPQDVITHEAIIRVEVQRILRVSDRI